MRLVPAPSLRITEIFLSIQGEARNVGLPTTFIRLTGCPLRCQYCDTAYAFYGGEKMTIEEIEQKVTELGARHVTVTGGEPLAQPNVHRLLGELCDEGFEVSLETSGALDISMVDARVSRVVDIKTPGSLEDNRNLWTNIDLLNERDQLKFVICNEADYEWSKEKVRQYCLDEFHGEVLFSPSADELNPASLAEWILRDRLPVRFQIQLHKVLWGDQPGR